MINYAANKVLTLSSTERGSVTTAQLPQLSYWSDLGYIRVGFKLVDISGNDIAEVVYEPRRQSVFMYVKITGSDISSTYAAGQWVLNSPDPIVLSNYAPDNLLDSPLISEYLDSLMTIDSGFRESYDSIDRLKVLRRWDKVDEEYLIPSQRLLGFYLNLSMLSPDQNRRLLHDLPYFYQVNGTYSTVSFLSYLTGSIFVATQLYTEDYITFTDDSSVGYPTNHIRLQYDSSEFTIDTELVIRLFYDLAPIEWVLDSIIGVTSSSATMNVDATMLTYTIQSAIAARTDGYLGFDSITHDTFDEGSFFPE